MPALLKVLVTLVAASLMLPLEVSAEESWDKQSYWYGFYIGAASMTCGFLEDGLLSKGYAKTALASLFEPDEEIPNISRKRALEEMIGDKGYKSCPLPR
jgi:hypothetical protein